MPIPAEIRAKAEIFLGDAAGQEKTRLLLQETGLPSGILPLKDIIECGYVEETRFVWLKQRRKVDHYFAGAGRHVSYAAEVSAFADKGRLRKITGVKAKELLIWVGLNEIYVDDPPTGKLHVKAVGGFSRTFDADAFKAADDGRRFDLPAHIREGLERAMAEEEERKKREAAAAAQDKAEEGEGKVVVVEEKKATAAAAAGGEEKEGSKEDAAGDGVGKVEEKLKEMEMGAGGDKVVRAEALAAKN